MPTALAQAGLLDTLAFLAEVVLPTIAKGILVRRPRAVALAERLGLDTRAVKRMQRLRRKYGARPLRLAVPGQPQVVLLSGPHVQLVLAGAPEPFAPATAMKRAALAHFEPRVSLASRPPERMERRRFNEEILETPRRIHSMAGPFLDAVDAEAQVLIAAAGARLGWRDFNAAWHRMVRTVVLGRGACDDVALTDMLARLRAAGNWAFLHPGHPGLRRRFQERLAAHLARAEHGSLAARIAARPNTETTAVADQATQWLFAFEPGGMATFRALALIVTQPGADARAREDMFNGHDMPFLRACLLESVRLWPTTPAILRQTTRELRFGADHVAKGTQVLIFTPFFHRDEDALAEANRFAPELWLRAEPHPFAALVPFSGGPGVCPARNLVPMLGAAMIAAILKRAGVALSQPERLWPDRPLPGTLDHFTLTFDLSPEGASHHA